MGRPGQVVELSGTGVVALGLEINVDYLAVRALDLTGAERHRSLEVGDNRRVEVARCWTGWAALASAALEHVHGEGLRPVGATVALPGLVDAATGALLVAPNLGWTGVPVVDELHERLSGPAFPVAADNEANLAALAELWEGTARGLRDVLYVSGEIGVGAGIIVGGELFRGSQGFGGEFGHMTIDPGGPRVRLRQPRLPGDARRARGPARRPPGSTAARPRPRPAPASPWPSSPGGRGWATSGRWTRCATPAAGSGSGSPRRPTCSTSRPSCSAASSPSSPRGWRLRSRMSSTSRARVRTGACRGCCRRRSGRRRRSAAPPRCRCGAC